MNVHAQALFVPKPLAHVQTSVATTYHFHPQADDSRFRSAWALCTVNDETGELTVCSDWGDFTHRWGARPEHLGQPSLTHFIASRSSAHYLADKLTSGDSKLRHRFSPEATVRYLCRMMGKRYRDGDIDKEACRCSVQELRELLSHDVVDERDFVARFFEIEDHDAIASEPWHCFQHEETTPYLVLLHAIIPALIAACAVTIAAATTATVERMEL